MKKEEILKQLKEDILDEKGEILNITEKGIDYFDYGFSWDDHTIFFRYDDFCTKEELKKIIFISDKSRKYGITEEYIASILVDAYSECFIEMMTTLRAIAIIHDIEEMEKVFEFANIANDDGVDLENCVGLTVFDSQICVVNEGEILRMNSELNDGYSGIEIYESGIGVTLIHECRHQMLDCNFLLSEKDFPISENSEDAVEEFARFKWDMIYDNHRLNSEFLYELNEI